MKTALTVARLALMGSGGLLLLLGLIIWTGSGDALIPVHAAAGSVLVLSLWTIVLIASRNGCPVRIVAAILTWSLAVVAFGLAQSGLLEGDWHWTVQVLHLVASMSLVGIGQGLVIAVHRPERRFAPAAQ